MISGLYSAASGLYAQKMQQEIAAYNLANVNVPGFKQQRVSYESFPDALIRQTNNVSDLKTVGYVGGGTRMSDIHDIFLEGQITRTDNNLDVALNGDGFFMVDTVDGIKYTRNGSFRLNQDGDLQTVEGLPVLNQNGNYITLASENFKIDRDGSIYENGILVDTIGVEVFRDPSVLQREGDSLFGFYGDLGNETVPSNNVQVMHGYLERSNVEVARELVHMIDVTRAYETCQKMIQTIDNTLDGSVNQVGRVG